MRSLSFVLAGALLAPLSAQQPALGWLPDNAVLVAQVDGLPKLREALEKTRLGRMLASPEAAERIEPLLRQLREAMEKDEREGGAAKAIQDALLGYGGRATLGFGFDAEKMQWLDNAEDFAKAAPWCLVALGPDGKTDLGALQAQLAELADKAGQDTPIVDLAWEGKKLRTVKLDGPFTTTLPFLHEGHLVAVMGAPLEGALEACLHNKGKAIAEAEVRLAGASTSCWVNLEGVMRGIKSAMESGGAEAAMMGPVLDAIGFTALQSMLLKVGAAGEHVAFDFEVALGSGERGLLGAFFDVAPGQPKLLDLVPVERPAWQVSKLSFLRVYEAIGKLVEPFAEPFFGMTRAQLEEQFTENFKVRLKEDLIAHLGDEYLNVSADLGGKPGAAEDALELEGECYALALANAKAFGESLEKVMRSQGLHEQRKTEDYRGVQVHRLELMEGLELHYAVSERVAVVGLGQSGAVNLRAVLDLEAEARTGAVRTLPAAVTERLDQAPKGWQDLGALGISWLADLFRTAFLSEIDTGDQDMAPFVEEMNKTVDLVRQLVGRFQLDVMVVAARTGSDRMLVRMIW